jgi:hypothetical protein
MRYRESPTANSDATLAPSSSSVTAEPPMLRLPGADYGYLSITPAKRYRSGRRLVGTVTMSINSLVRRVLSCAGKSPLIHQRAAQSRSTTGIVVSTL